MTAAALLLLIELGKDAATAERIATLLRSGLPGAAASQVHVTKEGDAFIIDPAPLARLSTADRNARRLKVVATSPQPVAIRLVAGGELSFPTNPGRTVPGTPPRIEILESPRGCATVTLAHELYTHHYRSLKGLPSVHVTPNDAVSRDADASERAARRHLRRRASPAELADARTARDVFIARRLDGVPDPSRAEKALRSRHHMEDFLGLGSSNARGEQGP